MNVAELHDATLLRVVLLWREAEVLIEFRLDERRSVALGCLK
jgi:hypothetical protein